MKFDDYEGYGEPLPFSPLAYVALVACIIGLCYCLYELFGK